MVLCVAQCAKVRSEPGRAVRVSVVPPWFAFSDIRISPTCLARKEQISKLDGKSFQRLVSAWRHCLGMAFCECLRGRCAWLAKSCLRLQFLRPPQRGAANLCTADVAIPCLSRHVLL